MYREAVAFLPRKGLDTAQAGPFRELRKDRLRDMDLSRALQQVDVITRHCVLDRYGEAGLAASFVQ